MALQPLKSAAEAAEILGVAKHTLDVWAMSRLRGPDFVRVGRRRMYTVEALDRYIRQGTVAIAAEA